MDFWRKVEEAKQVFIEEDILVDFARNIPDEILSTWKSSRENGVCWDTESIQVPVLTTEQLDILFAKKQILIDLVLPFVEEFQCILEHTEFTMSVCDENGVFLVIPHNGEKLSYWDKLNLCPGAVWNEETVGCTAHVLARKYQRPVQIIGTANYKKVFRDHMSCAAPIYNEYGDIQGTINLVQLKADTSRLLEHALGWATAVASAISSQFRVFRRNKRLKIMDSTLQATFENSEYGYISIDEAGYIININNKAIKLLKLDKGSTKINICSLFEDSTAIKHSLETGRPLYNKDLQVKCDPKIKLAADIKPFHGDSLKHAEGAILRFTVNTDSHKQIADRKIFFTFNSIIAQSPVMEDLKDTVELVSEKPVNVLLLGESGTGKEVFAQAIHNNYNPSGPFVAINCASIPHSLIESELFGYESGAFTGASRSGKKGKIEMANGGTLFLDEIGDMPIELQPVLLRVLEEKRVTRVGGCKSIPVDFRIISATNKPLCGGVTSMELRQDLYFRLAVVNIELPPLRKRGIDILLLADHFVKTTCERFDIPHYTISKETEKILTSFHWPGNVRQLENAMIYAVTVAKADKIIRPENLPKDILENSSSTGSSMSEVVKDVKNEMIIHAIEQTGNIRQAAKLLGISRTTIYSRLQKR
ncbi:sigma-54 interaction domain-containing protein [Geovibrio thiophilus]|uniref:sigma-54 interaction domain-containing protein n=1 Tax=Geovibrio thiophilus TaxID=139438 RepID=UPI0013E3B313|nr:sigma 54-interacting transcriptional regulator [Geovibrio thiophilus]